LDAIKDYVMLLIMRICHLGL